MEKARAALTLRTPFPTIVLLLACNEGVAQTARPLPQMPQSGAPLDTTVCVLARNRNSIDTHTLFRVRGRIYRVFDELVIRNNICRFVLTVPGADAVGSREKQNTSAAATPSGVSPGGVKNQDNLQTLMRYVNARVVPLEKGAACLVCGRYHVRATIVGHLETIGKPGADGGSKPSGRAESRHLVIQSVSNVKADDLYGKLYSRDKYRPVPEN